MAIKASAIPKAVTDLVIKAVGTGYYSTVGQLSWRGSTLRDHQGRGELAPCPVCAGRDLEHCCDVPVDRAFGLFDSRTWARRVYGLDFVPSKYVRDTMKRQEGYANRFVNATVAYYRCTRCDIYFQNQAMDSDERSAFYSKHLRQGEKFGRPKMFFEGSRFHRWADYLQAETKVASGSRFLDIGCAEGFLVLQMKNLGFDAHGIEPSMPMVRFGMEDLALDTLRQGDYDDHAYEPSSFKLINSYHVLEHVDDHRGFLRAAALHLEPGGYLVTSVPCPEAALEMLRSGTPMKSLRGVLGGAHHVLYSRAYLEGVLRAEGLEPLAHQVVDRESLLVPGMRIAESGEKWLGLNVIARKPSAAPT